MKLKFKEVLIHGRLPFSQEFRQWHSQWRPKEKTNNFHGGWFWYQIWWGCENFGLRHLCLEAKIGPKTHKLRSVLVSDLVVMGILGFGFKTHAHSILTRMWLMRWRHTDVLIFFWICNVGRLISWVLVFNSRVWLWVFKLLGFMVLHLNVVVDAAKLMSQSFPWEGTN